MLTSPLVELPDHAALVARSGNHPVPRWQHSATAFERAWAFGDAVAWTGRVLRALVAVGDGPDAGRLVRRVLSSLPDDRVSRVVLPVEAVDHVGVPLGDGDDWDWFWTSAAPAQRSGEAAVVRLAAGDPAVAAELSELLRLSSPRSSVAPGDAGIVAWYGVRDDDGALIACAAQDLTVSGAPHLRAIATHPAHRGRGLGADVTAAATRADLATGAEAVTLGMYADNDIARRMYERLGFRVGQAFATRAVVR